MKKEDWCQEQSPTYIYALDREICQVRKDEKLGCQTIEEDFFPILLKKFMDEKSFAKQLEMLLGDGKLPVSNKLVDTVVIHIIKFS